MKGEFWHFRQFWGEGSLLCASCASCAVWTKDQDRAWPQSQSDAAAVPLQASSPWQSLLRVRLFARARVTTLCPRNLAEKLPPCRCTRPSATSGTAVAFERHLAQCSVPHCAKTLPTPAVLSSEHSGPSSLTPPHTS